MDSAPPVHRPFASLGLSLVPLVFAVGLPLLLHACGTWTDAPFRIDRFHAKVIIDIGIAIILAVSLNVVNGYTGQFSLGHAGFMAVGGYVSAAISYYGAMKLWGSPDKVGGFLGKGELLFAGSCLGGGLAAALMGYIVGLPSLRLRGDYLAIVTLGFGEIIRVLLQQTKDVIEPEAFATATWYQVATGLGGSLGFTAVRSYTNLFWVYFFVMVTLIAAYRLKYSSYGRAFFSIREDEIAAEAVGINTAKYKVRAFVFSAFFAGIAGALFAHLLGTTLSPRELGFQKSIEVVIIVVLGGMGSISGAVLAAIILTILPEALRSFEQYRMIVYSLVLIVMMLLRPQGIFGLHEVWDIWGWWKRRRRKAA